MEPQPLPAGLSDLPRTPLTAALAPGALTSYGHDQVRLPPAPRETAAAGVALAGWLVPGLGQWATGRRAAAVALFLVIMTLFSSGLALADFACVNPREHKLEFVAHALIGGPTTVTLLLTEGRRAGTAPRWRDVGSLYVVVAGFLNLIALTSAAGEAVRQNQERRRKHHEAVRLALAVARLQALARRPASYETDAPAPWPPLALPETSSETLPETSSEQSAEASPPAGDAAPTAGGSPAAPEGPAAEPAP